MELRIGIELFIGFCVGAVYDPETRSAVIALGIVSIAIQW